MATGLLLRIISESQVFSLSFLLFLHITFLVHLYSNSGKNATSKVPQQLIANEAGYRSLLTREAGPDAPEAFELAEHEGDDRFDGTTLGTGRESDEDAKEFVISDERDDDWAKEGVL